MPGEYKHIKRLEMENELMRNFLLHTVRPAIKSQE